MKPNVVAKGQRPIELGPRRSIREVEFSHGARSARLRSPEPALVRVDPVVGARHCLQHSQNALRTMVGSRRILFVMLVSNISRNSACAAYCGSSPESIRRSMSELISLRFSRTHSWYSTGCPPLWGIVTMLKESATDRLH